MTAMLVHDTRLIGNTPNLAPKVYRVGGTTPLRHALGWIATYAKSQQGLDKLTIMCQAEWPPRFMMVRLGNPLPISATAFFSAGSG